MSCCDDKTQQGKQKSGLNGFLTGSRGLMLLGSVAVAGGLAFGWDNLVLLGIAPILLSLLPCLIMCGLGLCMMKCKDKKGEATEQSDATNVQARVEDASEVNAGTASTTRQLVDQSESIKQSSSKFQA